MKKIFISATLIIVVCVCAFAQKPYKVYLELEVKNSTFRSDKIGMITIDYGQDLSNWHPSNQALVDENGEKIEFHSLVGAMNYFAKLGWKLEQAYTLSEPHSAIVRWILSKSVLSDEEITEGFTTKGEYKKQNKR